MTEDVLNSSCQRAPGGTVTVYSVQADGWKQQRARRMEKIEAGTKKTHIPRLEWAPIKSIRNSVMPTCLSFAPWCRAEQKKSSFRKAASFSLLSFSSQHTLTKANIYWNTSIESLKDKSAIVKIDTSALIKKSIASSEDRELNFVGFQSGRSRRKRRMWRRRWAAVSQTQAVPGSFWPRVSVMELV